TGAEVIAIVGALTSGVSAGYSIATLAKGAPDVPKGPSPSDLQAQQDLQTQTRQKALIPGQLADAAARVGGGASPQLLEGLVGHESGTPVASLDVLDQIRKSLNVSA